MTAAPDPDDEPRAPAEGVVVLSDPRAIKALAHPARLAVLEAFFAGRTLTATECAEIAGLSASAMSYHLRALQKWGIIRRSAATGDGRERPWEATGDRLAVDSAQPRATAAGEAMLARALLDRVRAESLAWAANPEPAWYDSAAISSAAFWLTAAEAAALASELAEVVARHRRREPAGRPAGGRQVRVAFMVVPTSEPAGAPRAGAP
ncbi:MAG TPA: winged helix-turn-helix domain-containing protein [Jatrophihabitans sp.]|nr:winged helix-turn-helix domain-containing protein [Jatrophihabitans sp.]